MSGISQTRGPAPASPSVQGQTRQRQSATVVVNQSPVYDGQPVELLFLLIGNLFLGVVTVGIYRFWAKTRLRRYFLSRISVLNDRLTYIGTGTELFVGFLVVLGLIVPYLIGFELMRNYASSQEMVVFVFVQVLYYGSLMFLIQIAVYRAQRYRISRTTWRGIRGGQAGSAFLYAIRAMGWSAAVIVTVGLVYPLMRNDLMSYRINNSRFGQQGFWYIGGAGPLFIYWMLPWISVLVLAKFAFALFSVFETADFINLFQNVTEEQTEAMSQVIMDWSLIVLGALCLFSISNFWYRAAEVRHYAANTTFNKLKFESELTGLRLLVIYLQYGLLFSFVIGVFSGIAAIGIYAMDWEAMGAGSVFASMILTVVIGVAFFGISSVLKPLVVQHSLVRVFCETLTIKGQIDSGKLLQNQMKRQKRGEGLADAFDVDGF